MAAIATHELLRLATAGSVDDGKSTLIGRLLLDTKQLFDDQLDALETGELAHVTDGLRAEREQGITIDVAYRFFATPARSFIIADTPGHVRYTRNMVTGASTADLALVLVDARGPRRAVAPARVPVEPARHPPHRRRGEQDGPRRLGRGRVPSHRARLARARRLARGHGRPRHPDLRPRGRQRRRAGAARRLVGRADAARPPRAGGGRHRPRHRAGAPPGAVGDPRGRLPSVLRHARRRRAATGGRGGAAPDRTPTTVERIDTFDGPVDVAVPGMAVTVVPSEDLDAGRGAVFVDPGDVPVAAGELDATVCWMGDEPATAGKRYLLKHTSRKVRATVEAVRTRVDIGSFRREEAHALELNDVGDVVLRLSEPVFADSYEANRTTGAFILIDEHRHDTVAAGLVRKARERSREVAPHSREVRWHPSHLDRDRRWSALGTQGGTVWLTGLPASGKSTIATALEEALVDGGQPAYLLDGDNMRHGLSGDLGFDESARWENIRRVAHVARLFADSGSVAVVSLVSPLAEARTHARRLHEEAGLPFLEVFVDTPVEEYARRDPKGLYARAKAGRLSTLTGSGSPYEPPEDPELVVRTMEEDVESAVRRLLGALER